MPVKIRCPKCRTELRLEDSARGTLVPCPGCGIKLRAAAKASTAAAPMLSPVSAASPKPLPVPEEPEDTDPSDAADWSALQSEIDEEADFRPDRRSRSASWTTVAIGLRAILVGVVAFCALSVAYDITGGQLGLDFWTTAAWELGIVALFLVGMCLCAMAPDSAARRWALISMMTFLLGSGLMFLVGFNLFMGALGPQANGPGFAPPAMVMTALALTIGLFVVFVLAFVFWMMFHAAVGRFFGNSRLRIQSFCFIAAPFVTSGIQLLVANLAGPALIARSTERLILSATLDGLVAIWYGAIVVQTVWTIDAARKAADEE
jgi:hypothetical protein